MPMIRCKEDEHYYDDTKHSNCPYCSSSTLQVHSEAPVSSSPKTVKVNSSATSASSSPKTVKISTQDKKTEKINSESPSRPIDSGAPKTQFAWGSKQKSTQVDVQPVVGWLVVLEGSGKGQDIRLVPGMNTIGRGTENTVCLSFGDEMISRDKHANIIFDYKNKLFFLQHGDGNNLTYLNDSVVLQPQQMNNGDVVTLGNTKLRFIPFCDENCPWEL